MLKIWRGLGPFTALADRIGIGTASPRATLDVFGEGWFRDRLRLEGTLPEIELHESDVTTSQRTWKIYLSGGNLHIEGQDINGVVNGAVLRMTRAALTFDGQNIPRIVASSSGVNGYRKWSDGFIEQWGLSPSGATPRNVSFPTPFDTACDNVQLTQQGTAGAVEHNHSASVLSTSQFQLSGSANIAIFWRAVGR